TGTMFAAEPGDTLALAVNDGQARAQVWNPAIDRHARTEFADDEIWMRAAAAMQRARTVQIVPLRFIFAAAVEHLYAMVLAIGDIDEAIGVGCDIVHDVELARIGAGLAPAFEQPAVGCVF